MMRIKTVRLHKCVCFIIDSYGFTSKVAINFVSCYGVYIEVIVSSLAIDLIIISCAYL